jgi:hypothetical protein
MTDATRRGEPQTDERMDGLDAEPSEGALAVHRDRALPAPDSTRMCDKQC